jgi:hypothetical protein
LRIVRDALAHIADADLGSVIGASALYEDMAAELVDSGVLGRELQDTINGLAGLDRQIAAVVFLIERLDRSSPLTDIGVRPTAAHIADLLVTDITAGNADFRTRVATTLEALRDRNILMRNDDEYGLETTEGRAWRTEYDQQAVRFRNDATALVEARQKAIEEAIAKVRSLVPRVAQGVAQRDLDYRYGVTAPTVGEKIAVWVRTEWDASLATVETAARGAGPDDPVIHLFVPRPSGDAITEALVQREAAARTLDRRPPDQSGPAVAARQAMETRRVEAARSVTRLIEGVVNAAIVMLGGGTRVDGNALDERVRAAAGKAATRQFPRFKAADHAGWSTVWTRAREGAAKPFEAVGHQGDPAQHAVCTRVLTVIDAGASGTHVRNTLAARPYGWPRDAVDASLATLVRANILTVTKNGSPVAIAQLGQNDVGQAQFKPQTVVISNEDRVALRTLFLKADVNCKPNQEEAGADEFIKAVRQLAAGAGGPAPLPAPPPLNDIEVAAAKVGPELLKALLDLSALLTPRLEHWKTLKKTADERLPAWNEALSLARYAADLPACADAIAQLNAIEAQRSLLDPACPVNVLRTNLANALRNAVQDRHARAHRAAQLGQTRIQAAPAWSAVSPTDQAAYLAEVPVPPVPEVATVAELVRSLRDRNLQGWQDLIDATAGRADAVIAKVATAAEPQARGVKIDRYVVVHTVEDVETWIATQRDRLIVALARGPARIE